MQIRTTIILALVSTLSSTVLASTISNTENPKTLVITLSAGPIWANSPGETQTFFLLPDVEKTYTASKKNNTLFGGELFIGMQMPVYPNLLGQIGLAYATTSSVELKGDIWEDADPEFNNFFYNYKIDHERLTVKAKLILESWQVLSPYLSGSVGVALNHAHGFTITPKICEEVPAPSFRDQYTTAFTYTLGVGVQKDVTSNWQVAVGYEFADWGNSKLRRAPGQILHSGLSLNHLYTNQLQFSLSYLA